MCAASLRMTCRQAEPDFLRLGDRLQQLNSDASELTRKVMDAMNGCGTDTGSHILPQAVEHARTSLSELEADRKRIVENLSSVETILQEMLKLTRECAVLQKIAKSLKIIGISIGIESARFDDAEALFAPLAAEIRSLSDEIKKIARIVSESIESAMRSLSEVRSEMSRRIEQLTGWASEAGNTLDGTLPRVEEAFRFTAQVLSQAGKNAGRVSQLVGGIVASIQIHDSITQRADHVAEALLTAEKQWAAIRPDGNALPAPLKSVRSIVQLQEAQLDLLIRDVKAAYHTNKNSFLELKRIVDETSRLLMGIPSVGVELGDFSSGSPPEPDEASFTSIQKALRRIQALFDQGAETLTRISTAMDRATESAGRLSSHIGAIRKINFDIHLKALNAIAHSLQLGLRGKTFSVLVTEIKERAVESEGFVSCVEGIVDKIGKETQSVADRRRNRERVEEASHRLLLEKAIGDFSSACDLYRENAGNIPVLGTALQRNIGETITHVEFLNDLAEKLSQDSKDLQELLRDLPSLFDGETGESNPEMEAISGRYTMQQERGIHENFLDSGGSAEKYGTPSPAVLKGVARSTVKAGSENPLGDNVELF